MSDRVAQRYPQCFLSIFVTGFVFAGNFHLSITPAGTLTATSRDI